MHHDRWTCDRCSVEIGANESPIKPVRGPVFEAIGKRVDLCPRCARDFVTFLRELGWKPGAPEQQPGA